MDRGRIPRILAHCQVLSASPAQALSLPVQREPASDDPDRCGCSVCRFGGVTGFAPGFLLVGEVCARAGLVAGAGRKAGAVVTGGVGRSRTSCSRCSCGNAWYCSHFERRSSGDKALASPKFNRTRARCSGVSAAQSAMRRCSVTCSAGGMRPKSCASASHLRCGSAPRVGQSDCSGAKAACWLRESLPQAVEPAAAGGSARSARRRSCAKAPEANASASVKAANRKGKGESIRISALLRVAGSAPGRCRTSGIAGSPDRRTPPAAVRR